MQGMNLVNLHQREVLIPSYHNQEVVEHEQLRSLSYKNSLLPLCGKAAPAATPATVAPADSAENTPVSTLARFVDSRVQAGSKAWSLSPLWDLPR